MHTVETWQFTQLRGNVYIDSKRWAFALADAISVKTYERLNTGYLKRLTREG